MADRKRDDDRNEDDATPPTTADSELKPRGAAKEREGQDMMTSSKKPRRSCRARCCACFGHTISSAIFSPVGLGLILTSYFIVGALLFRAVEGPREREVRSRARVIQAQTMERLWALSISASPVGFSGGQGAEIAPTTTGDGLRTGMVGVAGVNRSYFTGVAARIIREMFRVVVDDESTMNSRQDVSMERVDLSGFVDEKDDVDEWGEEDAWGMSVVNGRSTAVLSQWSFTGALLYSVTVVTTIGYGHVTPRTRAGQSLTVVYALVGLPILVVYLVKVGRCLARGFGAFYRRVCCDLVCCEICKRRSERKRRSRRQLANESKLSKENSSTIDRLKSGNLVVVQSGRDEILDQSVEEWKTNPVENKLKSNGSERGHQHVSRRRLRQPRAVERITTGDTETTGGVASAISDKRPEIQRHRVKRPIGLAAWQDGSSTTPAKAMAQTAEPEPSTLLKQGSNSNSLLQSARRDVSLPGDEATSRLGSRSRTRTTPVNGTPSITVTNPLRISGSDHVYELLSAGDGILRERSRRSTGSPHAQQTSQNSTTNERYRNLFHFVKNEEPGGKSGLPGKCRGESPIQCAYPTGSGGRHNRSSSDSRRRQMSPEGGTGFSVGPPNGKLNRPQSNVIGRSGCDRSSNQWEGPGGGRGRRQLQREEQEWTRQTASLTRRPGMEADDAIRRRLKMENRRSNPVESFAPTNLEERVSQSGGNALRNLPAMTTATERSSSNKVPVRSYSADERRLHSVHPAAGTTFDRKIAPAAKTQDSSAAGARKSPASETQKSSDRIKTQSLHPEKQNHVSENARTESAVNDQTNNKKKKEATLSSRLLNQCGGACLMKSSNVRRSDESFVTAPGDSSSYAATSSDGEQGDGREKKRDASEKGKEGKRGRERERQRKRRTDRDRGRSTPTDSGGGGSAAESDDSVSCHRRSESRDELRTINKPRQQINDDDDDNDDSVIRTDRNVIKSDRGKTIKEQERGQPRRHQNEKLSIGQNQRHRHRPARTKHDRHRPADNDDDDDDGGRNKPRESQALSVTLSPVTIALQETCSSLVVDDTDDVTDPSRRHRRRHGGHRATVPISMTLAVLAVFMTAGTLLFGLWETDWNYATSSYFCFMTILTIGFGGGCGSRKWPGSAPMYWAGGGGGGGGEAGLWWGRPGSGGVRTAAWRMNEKRLSCVVWIMAGLSMFAMCVVLIYERLIKNDGERRTAAANKAETRGKRKRRRA